MRILLLFLISLPAYGENEFEISQFNEGQVCSEMVGTWYTDITINSNNKNITRYITKLTRNSDGSAYLKGVNLHLSENKAETWEFPSKWSCNNKWYTEKNEWGYTSFKIISLGKNNKLKDERANLSSGKVEFIEYSNYQAPSVPIANYFKQ